MNTIRSWLYLGVLLLATACSESDNTASTPNTNTPTSQTAVQNINPAWKTYLVGAELSYPPFGFKDKDGQPTGFEIELLQAIAQKEQFNVQFLHSSRSELQNTLNNGKFAIWASAITNTPERQANMDLSKPFLNVKLAILIADNETNRYIRSISDLKGKKISLNRNVSKASIEQATAITGSPDNLVFADSFYLALKEVYANHVIGAFGDSRVLAYNHEQNKQFPTRSLPIPNTQKELVFAVKKGNLEVLNKINSGLDKVKADGTYNKLLTKWFGNLK